MKIKAGIAILLKCHYLMIKIQIKEKFMSQVEPNIAKKLLETIETVWAKYPDLRLTQLLVNVIKPSESCSEIYYVEDSKLIELLNELAAEELTSSDLSTNAIDDLLMLHNEMLTFFNSKEDVCTWIHTKLAALSGEKPISLLPTVQGRKTLKQLLSKMKDCNF
tara:strand:+ start:1127 stop:1615 length:489 start_codon:yes stop_codon:yes gene_type:complete